MPNYNDGLSIENTLKAICQQSFSAKEVIVIDDGSQDNSVEIISRLAQQFPFIRLLRNEVNKGMNFSVNRGMKEASGDYIFFASANDKVLPGFFEKSINILAKHPEASLCTCDTLIENVDQGTTYERRLNWSSVPCYLSPKQLENVLSKKEVIPHVLMNTVILRKDLLSPDKAFQPDLEWHSDWFLSQTLLARHGCCYVPEPTAVFRWLGDSYYYRGTNNKTVYKRVFTRLMQLLTSPEYCDVIDFMIASKSMRFVRHSMRNPINVYQSLLGSGLNTNKGQKLFWHLTFAYIQELPPEFFSLLQKTISSIVDQFRKNIGLIKNYFDRLYSHSFHQYHKIKSALRKN
jgi:glycosyltransferase involved in cell wall biosynthesis